MLLPFSKYHGAGNDFILVDNREDDWESRLSTEQIRQLCRRHFGVGADGLMLLNASTEADFAMRYYNADGRESTLCGNGSRCIVAFAHSLGIGDSNYHFMASDGLHEAVFAEAEVRLGMNIPKGLRTYSDGGYWMDTGSPHRVLFTNRPVDEIDFKSEASAIRYLPEFAPDGTNVNFANVLSEMKLKVRTYERGVEEETLSCGTGVTAVAYAYANRLGLSNADIELETMGGILRVAISKRDQTGEKLELIGPAVFVFSGSVELENLSS